MKRFFIIIPLLVATMVAGCIENDLPLPVIKPRIASMQVEGASEVYINSEKQNVTITLEEQTDIRNVKISSVEFQDERTRSSWEITGMHDMSSKLAVTLSIYQDYVWTITTQQPIERYFSVEGQVGASQIDDVNRRVIVYVTDKQDVSESTLASFQKLPFT